MTRTTSVPMKKTSILARPTLLGASIALAFAGSCAQADPLALWQFTTTQASSPTAQASRAVQINASALANLQTGSEFTINLSNTAPLTAVLKQTISHSSGNKTIVAQLKGYDSAYSLVLTTGSQGSFGDLRSPDGEYQILSNNGQDWIVDLKASGLSPAANQDRSILVPPPRGGQNTNTNSAEASTIDLLLLYTPELANQYGTALQARLDHLVALSNVAYQESGVNLTLRLVHQEAVTASTTSNADTLQALTQSQGDFANVGALRNQYGADLVALLRPLSAEHRNCGTAWINGANGQDIKQYADYGYAVVSDGLNTNTKQYCSDYSLTQSLAHNMGSLAERSEYSDGLQGAYPYAYDHVVLGQFGTLMSAMTPKLGVFSNPDQLCLGTRCGVSEDQPSAANNAKALNQTRSAVANFRASSVTTNTSSSTTNTSTKTKNSSLNWQTVNPANVSKPAAAYWVCGTVYDTQTGNQITTNNPLFSALQLSTNGQSPISIVGGKFSTNLTANTAYTLVANGISNFSSTPSTISVSHDLPCTGGQPASLSVSSGTLNSVTITNAGWSTNEWVGYRAIVGNDNRIIIANDATTLYLSAPLSSLPTAQSTLSIEAAFYVSNTSAPTPTTGVARVLRGMILDTTNKSVDVAGQIVISAAANSGSGQASCPITNNPNNKGEFYCVVHDGWSGNINAGTLASVANIPSNSFTLQNSSIAISNATTDRNDLVFRIAANTPQPTATDSDNDGIPDWKEIDSDSDGIPDWVERGLNQVNSAYPGILSSALSKDNYVLSNPVLFANQLWRDTYGGDEFTSGAWVNKLTTNQTLFNGTTLQPTRPLTRAELVVDSMRAGNATTPGNPMYIAYPLRVLRHMYAFLGAPAQNNTASLDGTQFKLLVAKLIQTNASQFIARQAPADFSVLDTLLGTNNSYLTGAVDAAFIKDAKIRAGMAVDGQGDPIALAIDSNTNLTTRAAYLSALAESDEYLSSSGLKRKIFTSSTMFVLLGAADWNTWSTLFSNSQTYPDNLSIVSALFSFKDGQGNYIYNKRFFDGPNLTLNTGAATYDANGNPSVALSPIWNPVINGQTASITRYSDGVCSVADNTAQLPASIVSGNAYTDSSLPSDITKTISYKLTVNDSGAIFNTCQSVGLQDKKKPALTTTKTAGTGTNLSWSASDGSGLGSVTVKYTNDAICDPNSVTTVNFTGTASSGSVNNVSLTTGKHCYRVTVLDNANNSSSSDVSFDFTDTTPPSTPVLSQTNVASTSVSFSWSASTDTGGSGFAGYKIYRNGVLISGANPVTQTSYTDSNLTASTQYSYTVEAWDNAGNHSTSSPLAITTASAGGGANIATECAARMPGFNVKTVTLPTSGGRNNIVTSLTNHEVLVMPFVAGTQNLYPSNSTSLSTFSVFDFIGPSESRSVVLSDTPCDFSTPSLSTASYTDNAWNAQVTTTSVSLSVDKTITVGTNFKTYRQLTSGVTYYFNIRLGAIPTPTLPPECESAACTFAFSY